MIVDSDLRRRKLRDRVPTTLVTREPHIGHLGLGGAGDSRGMLEAKPGAVRIAAHDDKGELGAERELASRYTMFRPAFKGVDAVASVRCRCHPRYPNICAAGVCVAIPPVEATPVPTGAPRTGYMIESMVTAIVENIREELKGGQPDHTATMAWLSWPFIKYPRETPAGRGRENGCTWQRSRTRNTSRARSGSATPSPSTRSTC